MQAPARISPAQCGNRSETLASGGSSFIRERARALGMTIRELAEKAGRVLWIPVTGIQGHNSMGVKVQVRLEAALEGAAKVAPAECANVEPQVLWDRMNAHGFSQNEVARRVGISSSHFSQIMNGTSRGPAVRTGGRVPWGADVEYAYRAGYDGTGQVSMTPVVMPEVSAMLAQPAAA